MSIILGIIGEKKRSARKNNRKILEHNRLKPISSRACSYSQIAVLVAKGIVIA